MVPGGGDAVLKVVIAAEAVEVTFTPNVHSINLQGATLTVLLLLLPLLVLYKVINS